MSEYPGSTRPPWDVTLTGALHIPSWHIDRQTPSLLHTFQVYNKRFNLHVLKDGGLEVATGRAGHMSIATCPQSEYSSNLAQA